MNKKTFDEIVKKVLKKGGSVSTTKTEITINTDMDMEKLIQLKETDEDKYQKRIKVIREVLEDLKKVFEE